MIFQSAIQLNQGLVVYYSIGIANELGIDLGEFMKQLLLIGFVFTYDFASDFPGKYK